MELTAKNLGPWLGVVLILVCALGLVVPLFTAGTRKAGLQELERYHEMLCAERMERGSYPEEFTPPRASVEIFHTVSYRRIEPDGYRLEAHMNTTFNQSTLFRMTPEGIFTKVVGRVEWRLDWSFKGSCK